MVPIREPKTYSILLADDLTLVREGLAALCESQPHLRGSSSNARKARWRCGSSRRNGRTLLFSILTFRIYSPWRLCDGLKEANLPTRIVVLSTRKDRKTVVEALRCGVNAFLLKSGPSHQLLEAFEPDSGRRASTSPRSSSWIRSSAPGSKSMPDDPLEALSAREYQVFSLLVEGTRAKEIAARLELSPKTVDTYRASLMRKLDIHDVAGLVKFAIQRDLTSTR